MAAHAAGDAALDPALIRTESFGQPATFVVGGEWLTWQDLDALPTDPGELGTLLRAKVKGHPSGEDNELWESVTGMLRESPASPALRRALWQVAATIPGVQLIGAQTDAAGRSGTAVERNELDQGWYRVVYILNPADGTLLETKDIDKDGNVVSRETELVQEPTAIAPVAQPPLCGPGSVPLRKLLGAGHCRFPCSGRVPRRRASVKTCRRVLTRSSWTTGGPVRGRSTDGSPGSSAGRLVGSLQVAQGDSSRLTRCAGDSPQSCRDAAPHGESGAGEQVRATHGDQWHSDEDGRDR